MFSSDFCLSIMLVVDGAVIASESLGSFIEKDSSSVEEISWLGLVRLRLGVPLRLAEFPVKGFDGMVVDS